MRVSLEFGLADAEIDDVAARRLELLGAGQHLEGALGSQPRHCRCGLQHFRPPDGPRVRKFGCRLGQGGGRSEEHTSELQSLMRISYAVFCLQKKNKDNN